jgi:antitoxin ParD1/3/4
LKALAFYGKALRMNISLTAEQQDWLDAHVARGDFPSVEEAVRQLIGERIAERLIEEADNLAWAKPCVDEAVVETARGNVLTREEHRARNAARLSAFKD